MKLKPKSGNIFNYAPKNILMDYTVVITAQVAIPFEPQELLLYIFTQEPIKWKHIMIIDDSDFQ